MPRLNICIRSLQTTYPELPGGAYREQLGLELVSITLIQELMERGAERRATGMRLPVIAPPTLSRVSPAVVNTAFTQRASILAVKV